MSSLKEHGKPTGSADGRLVASLGTNEVITAVVKLLGDPDIYVRGHASYGVKDAVESGRATERFKRAVWEPLEKRLRDPDVSLLYAPMTFLLVLDRERALQLFQCAEILHPKHPLLGHILGHLNNARIALDHRFLMRLFQRCPFDSKDPQKRDIAQAVLGSLAVAGHPKARELINHAIEEAQHIGHTDRLLVAEAAMELLNGELDLDDLTMAATEVGLKPLPPAAEDMHRIREDLLHIDTEDIGFEPYFCSPASNNPQAHIALLQRIGAAEQAVIMRKGVKLLTARKRWPDLRERRACFAAFTEAEHEKFLKLEDEWRFTKIHLLVYMQRYSRVNQPAARELVRKLDQIVPSKASGFTSKYWRKRISAKRERPTRRNR